MKPARGASRERRHDRLIEAVEVERVLDRGDRVVRADQATHLRSSRRGQERTGDVEHALRLLPAVVLGIDDSVKPVARPRHEERELTGRAGRAPAHRFQQGVVRSGPASDDEHACKSGR